MIQILLFSVIAFRYGAVNVFTVPFLPKNLINRGFLEGPYCPIYGVGALLVISLLLPYKQHPVTLFIAGTILVTTLEYITSWLMEIMFHTRWWDYSNYRFNINGRVCLLNAILFGIMALVVCYGIHPVILDLLQKLTHTQQWIIGSLLSIGFLADLVTTTFALLRKNADFRAVETSIHTLRTLFKQANIFPQEEPLSQTIQRILDSTDADEILLAHIQELRNKIQLFRSHQKHTVKRLKKAFPHHRENRKEIFERISQVLDEHRK